MIALVKEVICEDSRPEVNKYCREKVKLFDLDESDEYLLVDVEINSTVILECRYWYSLLITQNVCKLSSNLAFDYTYILSIC